MMKFRTAQKMILISLVGMLALGACGIRGDLETPPPLWGDKDKQAEPKKSEKQEQGN